MTLLQLIREHRVVVHDRGRPVCRACGASLSGAETRRGHQAFLRRARRA